MGVSRQKYWSGLPCPPPGNLPDPGTEPVSFTSPALAGGFFIISITWEAQDIHMYMLTWKVNLENVLTYKIHASFSHTHGCSRRDASPQHQPCRQPGTRPGWRLHQTWLEQNRVKWRYVLPTSLPLAGIPAWTTTVCALDCILNLFISITPEMQQPPSHIHSSALHRKRKPVLWSMEL